MVRKILVVRLPSAGHTDATSRATKTAEFAVGTDFAWREIFTQYLFLARAVVEMIRLQFQRARCTCAATHSIVGATAKTDLSRRTWLTLLILAAVTRMTVTGKVGTFCVSARNTHATGDAPDVQIASISIVASIAMRAIGGRRCWR